MGNFSYYLRFARFRFKEPWTDFRSSIPAYVLFAFFVILLTEVWERFQSGTSSFRKSEVLLYVGVTETFFMTFLRPKNIQTGMEDFAIYLAKPRSWIGREFFGNLGATFGTRLFYLATLAVLIPVLSLVTGPFTTNLGGFFARVTFLLFFLAVPQALITVLFSSFKLSFPQTDYFILPFGKLFLSFGGVFAPLSDFGEPLKSIFLKLPGSDLFFQAAHFAVKGTPYGMSFEEWFLRVCVIDLILAVFVLLAFRMGKRRFQAWGG